MNITVDSMNINTIWLRDNCRCDECFNWNTNQRTSNDIELKQTNIENYSLKKNKIIITWSDNHVSVYDKSWIHSQLGLEKTPELLLWKGHEVQNTIPMVSFNDSENGIERLTKSILQYGIGICTDVLPTLEGTEQAATKIGPVMHTIYGGMWCLNNTQDFEKYQDTAYTNIELSAHTDNTYFIEPAGLQIFHCLKAADHGGETILVDGFKAVQLLKNENLEYYECLKSTSLEWQYVTLQNHYTCIKPIINTCQISGALEQIRYNIYDRSPRIVSTKCNMEKFFKSLKFFREIVNDPEMKWEITLNPGTVLFINNWRVMHGRKGFIGNRILAGCYIGMNALMSKGRILKLIR